MQTARRLYVYLISGVSLGVLIAGASSLLGIGLEQLGLPGPDFVDGREAGERLTLAAALVAVALPAWLIHWLLAERSVRPDQSEAAVERSATLRGLYMALVLGALLLAAANGMGTAIHTIVHRVAGTEYGGESVADGIALLLAAAAAWLYHGWVRQRDWRRGPITDGGAWLPRTYLYAAAFGGLMSALTGFAGLLDVTWTSVLDASAPLEDVTWTAFQLADHLGSLLVGGVIWVAHWWHAQRIVREPGWRGESERPARLRQAYFVAVIVAALGYAIWHLGSAIGDAIRAAAGLHIGDADPARGMVVSLLSAIPFAIVAWLHAGPPKKEARASGLVGRIEATARLSLYPIALVGLAFAAVGSARFGGAIITGLFSRTTLGGGRWLVEAVAANVPFIVIGAGVWWWAWRGITARVAADPAAEAASTIRRTTILAALAGSVLSVIGAAAIVLYRLFGGLFGVPQPGDPIAEVSVPLATLVVALAVGGYHLLLLRTDQSRAPVEPDEVVAPRPSVAVRISGPAGSDVRATLSGLRGGLPEGFELEVIDDEAAE